MFEKLKNFLIATIMRGHFCIRCHFHSCARLLVLKVCLLAAFLHSPLAVAEKVEQSPKISMESVLKGLDKPLAFDFVPGRTKKLCVLDSDGRLRMYNIDLPDQSETLLDLSEESSEFVQREVIDFVLHPDFLKNGRFFISSTMKGSYGMDLVISEFHRSQDLNAKTSAEKEILRLRQPFVNQRRVPLVFDKSGKLLIGISDGGGDYDPKDNAQNKETLFGSILRLDVDQESAYIPPLDNPFVLNDGGKREIFAYGFRYPSSIVVDSESGKIYASDHGMNTFEEINQVTSGSNYGWAIFEGSLCLRMQLECRNSRVSSSLIKYGRKFGQEVMLAGALQQKVASSLNGHLLFADLETTELWAVELEKHKPEAQKLLKTKKKISDFATDATGHIYLSDIQSGEIFRFKIE